MLSSIVLEPVAFLLMVFVGLIMLTSQELYLMKACKVNLNFTAAECENINNHSHVQISTQQYVSEIQAYNGVLQSVPGIVLAFFAGPLSDKFGRKPLIVFSLFGFLILSLVFLINSFWFDELKVEYLLFECLQDITGGEIVFGVGINSLMVDITTKENRTRRIAVLDTFFLLGLAVGLQLSGIIRHFFGWVPLFATSSLVLVLNILYVIFKIEEGNKVEDDLPDKNQTKREQSKARFLHMMKAPVVGFKSVWRKRPDGSRIWVFVFMMTMTIQKFGDIGSQGLLFMFLKLQYNAEITDVTNIALVFGLMMIINQMGLVPLLSGKFQFRDTSILIIGMTTSIIGCIILAIGDNLNIILLSCFFGSLYISINSTARSAMTKLVDPADIGSLFGMCGIIFVTLSLISKPFYSLVYRATVQTFPAAFLYLTLGLLVIVLVLIISAHVGMKKVEESIETENKTYEQVEVAKVMSERLLY